MVINKDKVILLPREFTKSPNTFICPCEICAQRAYDEQIRKSSIEEVKEAVEEMLNTTSLYTRMFNIDIVTLQSHELEAIKNYTDKNGQKITDLTPFVTVFAYTYKTTLKFNKSYRHPLICKLHDVCEQVGIQISTYRNLYQNEEQEEVLLWQYQKILSLVAELLVTAKVIESESFLKPEITEAIIQKAKKAKASGTKILRQRFIQALELQHFHPKSSTEDFHIEYIY